MSSLSADEIGRNGVRLGSIREVVDCCDDFYARLCEISRGLIAVASLQIHGYAIRLVGRVGPRLVGNKGYGHSATCSPILTSTRLRSVCCGSFEGSPNGDVASFVIDARFTLQPGCLPGRLSAWEPWIRAPHLEPKFSHIISSVSGGAITGCVISLSAAPNSGRPRDACSLMP